MESSSLDKKPIDSSLHVTHVTSVHSRYDTRILENQCVYLAANHKVSLFVTDGMPEELYAGVSISSIYRARSKFLRLLKSFFLMPLILLKKKSDIFHFHDPELLLAGLVLRISGRRVVFDVHEDYEFDLRQKDWLPTWMLKLAEHTYVGLIRICFPKFSAIITVTEKISSKLPGKVTVIKNYPRASLIEKIEDSNRPYTFCYLGSISIKRGLAEIIELAKQSREPMLLVGGFANISDRIFFEQKAPENIHHIGYVPSKKVSQYLIQARIGLHLVKDDTNLLEGIPVKVLEYVAHGMPVICSDSDAWRREFSHLPSCYFVNPSDVQGIIKVAKIISSIPHADLLAAQNVLREKYSWETQFSQLEDVYKKAMSCE